MYFWCSTALWLFSFTNSDEEDEFPWNIANNGYTFIAKGSLPICMWVTYVRNFFFFIFILVQNKNDRGKPPALATATTGSPSVFLWLVPYVQFNWWRFMKQTTVMSWVLGCCSIRSLVSLSLLIYLFSSSPGLWWGWYGGGGTAPSAGGRDQSGARPVWIQRHWLQVRPFWCSGVVHSYDCVRHCNHVIVLFLTII